VSSVLDRREGEQPRDHVERLLVEPLCDGATAIEIAQIVGCAPALVHDLRRERLAVGVATVAGDEITKLARETARGIGWTRADGGLGALLRHALVVLELASCDDGTCRHAACQAKRSRSAGG
jgi:hypothetical protein